MKKYCFDMSGISNPLEIMPIDIHKTMWARVCDILASGRVAVTVEIYGEMLHIPGPVGDCIRDHYDELVLEVGQGEWESQRYVDYIGNWQIKYQSVISEFNGNRKDTIGLNDLSIIALGKTLQLPVVSMEAEVRQVSDRKKRIPEVCGLEGVEHCDFSGFLRKEGIVI